MRRTKIVATIGPASRSPAILERLLKTGVDVVRLNFSHGEHEDHLAVIRSTREISTRLGSSVAILQDLCGPKIRTGKLQGGAPVELVEGERITITTDESVEGTSRLISTTYHPLPQDVRTGDRILLDDGNLELRVLGSAGSQVECEIVVGGLLKAAKGMNLPGVKLSTPALTEKDRRDLAFGLQHGVDFVALSFVRQAQDVLEAKDLIRSLGGSAPLIAKIEKREAIDDLPSILEATDGVMVARGDLGVELSTEEVPTLQKRIIEMANGAGKTVITATQMLESMIEHPRPTRAEASDVANAILDGTDAIMLSGETAAGRYPVEAVETMARIARYTEVNYGPRAPERTLSGPGSQVARSLAHVGATVAEELGAKLILVFTTSGATARLVSNRRPAAPIVAITYLEDTFLRLALAWGVVPLRSPFVPNTDEMIVQGEALLKRQGLAQPGDLIIMLGGQSHTAGATDMLRVHIIA